MKLERKAGVRLCRASLAMIRTRHREPLKDLEQEVTPAAAGGFAEVQVEQVVAGTRVVPSEAGRSMLL